jgi:hypothetical protein
MTKPLQGSHFRRLHDYVMDMTSIKKRNKNTSTSKPALIKKEGPVKVRLLKRNKTARKWASPSSVGVLAQQVCHRSVLDLYYPRLVLQVCTYLVRMYKK